MSKNSIFVNCWKCGNKFDITSAERCYEHLNESLELWNTKSAKWTTKCSHCGACICHKFDKMKPVCIDALESNPKLMMSEIRSVMPSVYEKLCPPTKYRERDA